MEPIEYLWKDRKRHFGLPLSFTPSWETDPVLLMTSMDFMRRSFLAFSTFWWISSLTSLGCFTFFRSR